MMFTRWLFALFCLFLVSAIGAKDLGMTYGEPTPALAMYAAQENFAADRCIEEGLTTDTKGAKKLLKHFNRLIQLRYYQQRDDEFAKNLEAFIAKYNVAWAASDQESRRSFCGGFSNEVAAKNGSFFGWIMPIDYFRRTFSPLSQAAEKRRHRIAAIALVGGAAVSTAGTISSGHDAVNSARQGDWARSNDQMALSRQYSQAGLNMPRVPELVPGDASPGLPASVFEIADSSGTHIVPCPVVVHFFSYSAPPGASVWMTYQPVSMKCKDAVTS